MPAPTLSVLMPVYNAEPYIAEAIESILGQTFTDFELLVLDDGSSDASAEIVKTYAAKDPRLLFRARANRGLPVTLNELATMARAPLLARMDADDISLPERFEKQMIFLADNPDVVAVGGQPLLCDGEMRPIFVPWMPTDHDKIDANNLVGNISIPHPAVVMRTDAFHKVGGYDEDAGYGEDLDLWLRLAEVGKLANLPDVLFKYRLNENSISGSNSREQIACWQAACEAAWQRRGLPEQKMAYNEWRPTGTRASRRDFALRWGWQAWKAGNRDTARRFFLNAVRIDPFSGATWKALVLGSLRRPS